jgi:hypothetical protein
MPLLFVHGRSQHGKNPNDLKTQWLASLKKGSEKANVQFDENVYSSLPYFGDKLHAFVKPKRAGSTDSSEYDLRGDDPRDSVSKVYEELKSEYEKLEREYEYEEPDAELKRRGLAPVILQADKAIPILSDFVVSFLKDVNEYFSNPKAREAVLKIVKTDLKNCTENAKGKPLVIVAHSLGSVVIHDLLTSCSAEVDLLLTVGSPLGINGIYKRLQSWESGKMWPENVRTWINASDPRDRVALASTLGRSNIFSGKAKDGRCDVLNLVDIDNDTENKHGISGYLENPGVARCIISALNPTSQ